MGFFFFLKGVSAKMQKWLAPSDFWHTRDSILHVKLNMLRWLCFYYFFYEEEEDSSYYHVSLFLNLSLGIVIFSL